MSSGLKPGSEARTLISPSAWERSTGRVPSSIRQAEPGQPAGPERKKESSKSRSITCRMPVNGSRRTMLVLCAICLVPPYALFALVRGDLPDPSLLTVVYGSSAVGVKRYESYTIR